MLLILLIPFHRLSVTVTRIPTFVPRLELFPFSYFDPMRKRWIRARYVASLDEIKQRYAQYRIEGQPEIREFATDARIITDVHLRSGEH